MSNLLLYIIFFFFFFQAEDGIRDAQESRGLGDVYKRQGINAEYGGPTCNKMPRAVSLNLCCRPDLENDARLAFVLATLTESQPPVDLACFQEVTSTTHTALAQFAADNEMSIFPAKWDGSMQVAVTTLWRPEVAQLAPSAEPLPADKLKRFITTADAQGAAMVPRPTNSEHLEQEAKDAEDKQHSHRNNSSTDHTLMRLTGPEGLDYSAAMSRFGGWTVCNMHLPAGLENNELRVAALDQVLEALAGTVGPLLLCGDLNFDLDREEQMIGILRQADLKDAWRTANPQHPGYTEDTFLNPLRQSVKNNQFQQRRVDGIFSRGDLLVQTVDLCFCHRDMASKVYASDHFGLDCTFRLGRSVDLHKAVPEQPDHQKMQLAHASWQLLCGLGEDTSRPGLRKTPDRVAKAWLAFTEGYHQNLGVLVNDALFDEGREGEVVLVKDITFYSMCEHHMVPFFGKANVAYIASGKVIGLSKLVRIVEMFAKRLQVQERLTRQVAAAVEEALEPLGVAVSMTGVHMCMCSRGVRNSSASTTTSCMHGLYKTDVNLRNEFYTCLLYTSDAADEEDSVDLGGRRIIKKKKKR
eukprot:TRINITY_DN13412_c0_g3_i1.p1 TRINITY_DN13412_c0_g3~~TRINITY_DN13412_c0_g3_i1.p1  ORF type:complete len:582 (-),score=153.35 TRINITY_DN13412_c0_g3_i1:100-1845(-)